MQYFQNIEKCFTSNELLMIKLKTTETNTFGLFILIKTK
ncbi:hypothetical protein M23134_05673 [Microscilla marina ATCC 23134]|uniref:Uncharacterized protein n=1 Tax=Microscilla marina ATCC 23134 TaxID=313606 RepID=A1ZID3_MICM2|nr:hypothetical protein M23134_05673 [Microscilla marina ATCC 23134]